MHLAMRARERRTAGFDPLARALLLAAATVIGCASAAPSSAAVDDKAKPVAETPSKPTSPTLIITPPAAPDAPTVTITGTPYADPPSDAKSDSDTTTVRRAPRRRGHIQLGNDEFDSFGDALHTAPWVIGMALLIAALIFLTPILLLIGIIWYKLRKTRLQNDAVLKLAERGVMPPTQAVDAVMSGVLPATAAASASVASGAAPVYEQAVISRRRAVWSDLRKGVFLTAVGLAFVFYSMIESAEANWLGLVLMFLGVGYIMLWWFEDRHLQRREAAAGADLGKS